MLQNILKLKGVASLKKQSQKSILGGHANPDSCLRTCRTTSDCRNEAPGGVCIDGYCLT
ncbi:hypothetical protein [Aquimarina algiphila]|uniref:hypothetical protein n=1 Tax=Aquimarina algiphila TaxID=2047982 RepID=UPI00232DD6E4|nr:hypothetical protein [Aquimarina algiphila]